MLKTIRTLFVPIFLGVLLLSFAACGGGTTESGPAAASSEAPATVTPEPTTEPSPEPIAGAAEGNSVISGTVTYEGNIPNFRPLDMNADPACAAKHDGPVAPETLVLGEGQALANIFVQVKNPPAGNHEAPTEAVVIDQDGCRYHPHVVGLLAGQPLLFRNSDGILHNVHGRPQENREFNVGMPPTVTEKTQVLSKPEPLFPVKCDVHPWMQAFVAVMEHPYFAVTGDDGLFAIEGLPAGTYDIEAWHERLGTQTGTLTVSDEETGILDIVFTPPSRS